MIPLHKLETLPRTLRLRKAANIIEKAEYAIGISGRPSAKEAQYLCGLLQILLGDIKISAAGEGAIQTCLSFLLPPENGEGEIWEAQRARRAINNVYYCLLNETGAYKADWDFVNPDGELDASKRKPFSGMQVYLEDIRSPYNVGAMFRASESFGAEKIWLSPLCADPNHKRAERTALGCVGVLPWERFPEDPFSGNSINQNFSGPFFTLETGGTPLEDFSFPRQGVVIAGSEELGVSPQALARADKSLGRVSIKSYGAKGSLNVSVAFGIVMQAWASSLDRGHKNK